MGVALIVKKLKSAIAKLRNQIAIGIKNARKYIIALIDCENKLTSIEAIEAAVQPPLKSVTTPVQLNLMDFLIPTYSEEQVKKAFIKVGGCLQRYWKPEMLRLIPELIGLEVRMSDPWDWMSQFTPIQEMEKLGWSDRIICYCIGASRIL